MNRFWEIIEHIRKSFFCGLLVLILQGSALQIVIGIIVGLGSLHLHTSCRKCNISQ
jgi:hypothetical protein